VADHVRRQLRDAVVTRLTGLATTGANVYAHRAYPLERAKLPALRVYTVSETVEIVTIHAPMVQDRNVEVRVEGVEAAAEADLDDTLDQIAKEVETALSAALTVGGKPVTLAYTGCEIELDDEAAKPHGIVTLSYTARLFTASNAPDVLQN
jgi:hypothetical protein